MTLTAKPSSATDRTRHYRRSLFFILVLGGFLSGCMGKPPIAAISGTPAAAQFTFEQYEVVTGSAKRQTVLTGFLLGGTVAELAVVHIDENDDRRLRIYAFGDGTWVPRLEATLGLEVLFVDVAKIGGRDRLVTYERCRLNWFDPESATERALVAVTSNFKPPRRGEIPHVDVTRDVNDDDRDDLVVPDSDGFWVFIQRSDGAFAGPVRIGPSTEMARIYGADGYRYNPWSQSRVHEMDYNRDGRTDLVFWNEDHFEVHLQDERGLFSPVTETFTTDVAFDSDEISSLASGHMTGRVLHSLTDLNGDGVGDLVVHSLEGRSISSKHSTYEVHFGKPAPEGGTMFARGVDTAIQSDGRIQLGMDCHDFDRDGQVDLMFTTIEVGYLESSLWKRLKGFMGDEIKLDLEFYRTEGGLYPNQLNATRRINLHYPGAHREPGWVPLDIALRGGKHESRNNQEGYLRAFKSILLIGDVTGDGRSDLLLGFDRRSLPGLRFHPDDLFKVYIGVPGPVLFSRQPEDVAVPMPDVGEWVWLVDLNKDGKQDILLHYPSCCRGDMHREATTEPPRVTMLIAR